MAYEGPFSNSTLSGRGNISTDVRQLPKKNPKAKSVVVFNIAVNSKTSKGNDDFVEGVHFWSVKLFGANADMAMREFHKGMRVDFVGDIYADDYENKHGELVEKDIVHISRIAIVPSFSANGDDDGERRSSRGSSSRRKSRNYDDDFDDEEAPAPRSRRRSRNKPVEDFDQEDEGYESDDDLEPQAPRSRRSRSGGRGGSRRTATVDDDIEEYSQTI